MGLKGGGGTEGTEQMLMGDVQHRCLPAHRCMPRKKVKRSWFPPQVPGSVFRAYPRLASTILNFNEEQYPFLKGMVILISCSTSWSWWRIAAEEQDKSPGCTGKRQQRPR